MYGNEGVDLLFICFNRYGNISSCYFHNQLLPEHGKTRPLVMKVVNGEKGDVTTRKSLVLKSCSTLDFHS